MAVRRVRSSASDSAGKPCAAVNPLPGSIVRPAVRDPATASVPVAIPRTARTPSLPSTTGKRRGTATSVGWIVRVLYSAVTGRTARTTIPTWPRRTPASDSFVRSRVQGESQWA